VKNGATTLRNRVWSGGSSDKNVLSKIRPLRNGNHGRGGFWNSEGGVSATPIVKIEEAAGLAPGSGAFYKHFRSKSQLLDAAVADAAATSSAGADLFATLDGVDILEQARVIARGTWFVFDAHRNLVLVMAREPEHRPPSYSHDETGWPGDGPAFVATWLQANVAARRLMVNDPRATAVVLLDALTSYWLQQQTESSQPYGINDERFVNAWTELIAGLLRGAD
jgi:AcrR family transcriptional regulator